MHCCKCSLFIILASLLFFDKMTSILINMPAWAGTYFCLRHRFLLTVPSSQSHATSCLSLLSHHQVNNKCNKCKAMGTSYCYRFLFRFTKLYGMMWTHFSFNIYVEYEFKNFGHYFNVFWWKKQPFEKKNKTGESTTIAITKECPKY